MKNERAVCDRNSDLKGNLLVWITSKQLKLHQKHKMALIQYCLSATWRLSFLSHFWAEKSPSLMNGARFCIQICRNDGLILDLHCRQKNFHLRKCCIFPVFDPRNSLFGEIASYSIDLSTIYVTADQLSIKSKAINFRCWFWKMARSAVKVTPLYDFK